MPNYWADKKLCRGYGKPPPQRAMGHNNFCAHCPSRLVPQMNADECRLAPALAELFGSEAADAVESEGEDQAVFFS